MDYLELVNKFEDTQKIPYDELLNTTEWKERRINIIQRDKSCCTNCGKTQSIYHMNFNISF
jgi:5-methylcytosine-specific restriction endonuclease McrA